MRVIYSKNIAHFLIYLSAATVLITSFAVKLTVKNTIADKRYIPIQCVQNTDRRVALTYNITADSDINRILTETENEKVTFFTDSDYILSFQSDIQKIIQSGNQIALLEKNLKNKTKEEIYDRLAQELETAGKVTMQNIDIIRFENSLYDNNSVKAVFSLGLYPVQWSATGLEENFSDGDIILITDDTNIKKLLQRIKKDGFRTETVSNLMIKGEYKVDINGEMIPK